MLIPLLPPALARDGALRRLPCSLGVTNRTFLGDVMPEEDAAAVPEDAGETVLPPDAATPSIPRTFSTALLSAFAHGSRLTNPNPAFLLAASRFLDSSCKTARLNSRRGPGPQSCIQPGVAQPPSLTEGSFNQVVIQAMWPPCPQP